MDPTFSPDRIRKALTAKSMTQEQLARELNVSLKTVANWVAGRSDPRGQLLIRMAAILDRPAAWFYPNEELTAA